MADPVMRALVHDRYGPPETLRLEDIPRPHPGPGEVLVRVLAASVNSWDWDLTVGTPMGRVLGPFRPPHKVLGADIAGIVEHVGEGVTRFKAGDAVFGDLSDGKWGGFAEYVCADATALAAIPQGLSFIDAAALPQAGGLAVQALRRRPELGEGDSILFNGAGGGVGTLGIQIARASGARVVAVDRAEKRESLLALGADAFIDYQEADFTAGPERYDFIIDVVANRRIRDFSRALKDGGHLVVVGGTIGSVLSVAALGPLLGRRRGRKMELLVYRASAAESADLARRCVDGALRVVVDGVYPLERGAEALRRVGEGRAVGKVVITPDGQG